MDDKKRNFAKWGTNWPKSIVPYKIQRSIGKVFQIRLDIVYQNFVLSNRKIHVHSTMNDCCLFFFLCSAVRQKSRDVIKKVVNIFNTRTCLKWLPHTSALSKQVGHNHYVEFQDR